MTQTTTNDHTSTQKHTLQDHHKKVVKHHDEASKRHREAAKQHDAGDHKTAAHRAQIAHGHTHETMEHSVEASKKHANTHTAKK